MGSLALAASLALSGCGSDDSTGSNSAALNRTPIRIGYAASMSGAQASNGLSGQAVAHAWQEYTNAHGGLLGHPVEIARGVSYGST